MLTVIFTLDYEIHGNGEGDPDSLMVEPTRRMLDLFDRHGAKLTIMADVAEILKFKEYKERMGRDDYCFSAIEDQLRDAIRRGHDVQLHLHTSYLNARYEGGHWAQDWSEYNFASLPFERMNEVVRIGKQYLENLLQPVDPAYECNAFRAANWAVSPSGNVVRALVNNRIRIDTSVFKYGRREGIVSFDYSNADSNLVPWPVDEDDICRRNSQGQLIEVPIYCERRWIGVFLTPDRVRRVLMTKGHSIKNEYHNGDVAATPRQTLASRFVKRFITLFQGHAWKADFNQCTAGQLSRALTRAAQAHDPKGCKRIPFVLIGHSKQFTKANERGLAALLRNVAGSPTSFEFGTFKSTKNGR